MTAPSVLSAANARLEYLLLSDEAPARCDGDLRVGVVQLQSELVDLERQVMDKQSNLSWKPAIRLAYDIEDTIDSYAQAKSCGCLSKLFSARSLQADLEIFRGKIKELIRLVGENSDDAARGSSTSSGSDGQRYAIPSSSVSAGSEAPIVGMEMEVKQLIPHLRTGDDSVIAIVGLGGSGKTTLARLVFNHSSVKEHFDLRAWVTVSMDLQPRLMLEKMLSCVCNISVSRSISEMETTELMEQLYKVLKGRRYLLVLDDVWSLDAWQTLRSVLPQDDNGSRVIITTRSMDSVPPSSYFHRKMLLSEEESWALMATRLQLPDTLDAEAKKIGQQIIEQCGGLPLALSVISNALRGKTMNDWKVVLQSLERPQDEFGNILNLIYDRLPTHLKPCFVYLGHFPSDQAILVDRLYLLWMAEGLISTKGVPDLSNFDIAENYFEELVARSMVMVQKEEEWVIQRPKSCQIHDLLHDLCIKKGMEEEFFKVADSLSVDETSFTSRRLAIYLNSHENKVDGVSLKVPEAKTVRSLLLFETKQNSKWPSEIADLKEFRWLRVLGFDGVNFRVQKLPKNIDKLVYLRYLSFRGCHIMEFPSSFSNFPFLETLDLWVIETCRMTIPNVLRKLTSLRHLYFPVLFQIGRNTQDDKLRLDTLTRLEILENFDTGLCDVADLQQLKNIQVFSGVVDGNNEDLEKIVKLLNRNVRSSRQTSLLVKRFDCYSERRFSILKNLLDCHALHALEIEGFLGELQRLEGIGSTSNFTKMVFNGSEFGQDPMQILGKLPNLRSLVLCNDAFVGKTMECSETNFPQLRSLKLAMLQSLETLEVKAKAMPNLTVLTIEQCEELQMLPNALMEIWALKEIKIGSMPRKFQENVRQMARDRAGPFTRPERQPLHGPAQEGAPKNIYIYILYLYLLVAIRREITQNKK